MSSVIVGGVPIPVTPQSPVRPRLDAVDRARFFDLSYRAVLTGTPKRDWQFTTIPIPRRTADLYESILKRVPAQTCSGDIIGGANNLLVRSEEFGTTWTTTGATVQSDIGTAPDGTVTADKIKETAVTSAHSVNQSVTGLTDNTIYTFSDHLYPVERTWAYVAITGKDGVGRYTFFNLSTGAIGSSVGSPAASGIEAMPPGSGWYRAYVAATVGSGGATPFVTVGLATGDLGNSYLGVLNNGAYTWGAQLEPGSSPGPYVQTTSAPVNTASVSCFSEVTGWVPVARPNNHMVQLSFVLHEA